MSATKIGARQPVAAERPMGKAGTSREVLAFYSSGTAEAKSAFRALAGISARVSLYSDDQKKRTETRYGDLRLAGESLIVAEVSAANVEAAVKHMQNAGRPAVFVLRPGYADIPDAHPNADTALPASVDPIQTPIRPDRSKRLILARLRESEQTLDAARRDLLEANRLGHAMTASAEWLLDNAYLIRTQMAETRLHLPRNPKLFPGLHKRVLLESLFHKSKESDYAGPDIYDLAEQLVATSGQVLAETNITACLHQYQRATPLTIAELWYFPLLLRMALFESLARLATRVSRVQQLREVAYLWANRLVASTGRGTVVFEQMLARMAAEPFALHPHFVTSLVERLQDQEDTLGPLKHWLESPGGASLAGVAPPTLSDLLRSEHTDEALDRISTANGFTSLRALARIDFAKIVEAVSLVDAALRTDPSGLYAQSDFATRDQCRRAVERVALQSNVSEREVAEQATRLAARPGTVPFTYAPYYLSLDGIAELETSLNAKLSFRVRTIRKLRQVAARAYLSSAALVALGFVALALGLAWQLGVHQKMLLAVLGLLALFPLGELSIQIVNALVISLLPPDLLPKMDFQKGIPTQHATLVVVPMMLTSLAVVHQEVEKLEVRYLANREDNLYFSLFPDFTDSPGPTAVSDAALLAAARDGIDELNRRYPLPTDYASGVSSSVSNKDVKPGRFLLFHRDRVWSESERGWIGRERKRGKIEDLNTLLAGQGCEEILIAGHLAVPIRYVITLDADTQLPVTSARRLVETISHPLNQVEMHEAAAQNGDAGPVQRTRRRGFTIVQPRVSIALPGATATRFTRMFADTRGTDPYSQSVSDAQQDLFGEAIFHGKAIYDMQSFHTMVGDRFPNDTLLSHDLIEGAHVGVALANDIELFENLPLNYASYCQRQHRWIRGDWQIAPWILPRVPVHITGPAGGPTGGTEPNPLTLLNRWRILDNLRRTLVPMASLLLLLFGWLISAAPGAWSLVVGLAIVIPALAPLVDRLARTIQGSVRGTSIQGWSDAADELVRAIVMISFLPHQAWLSVDAIVRVFYRRYVSRHHLLQWQTAESVGSHAEGLTRTIARQMLVISGVSIALAVTLFLKHAFAPTSVFLALWMFSPGLMHWLGRPMPLSGRDRISTADKMFLRRLARLTWRYFDDLVNQETNWLPPDNSQLALRVEVAQRTSPTNIGLWLTSALAGIDFGYLTADSFLERSTHTMATLHCMERYEGHLLNWYDTKTLAPLLPCYVSTVDSGNFLASLWVFQRGIGDLMRAPLLRRTSLRGIADTLGVLSELTSEATQALPLHALQPLLAGKAQGYELMVRLRMAAQPVTQLQSAQRWQTADSERGYWAAAVERDLNSWVQIIQKYLRWMETLAQPPDSFLRGLGEKIVSLRRLALKEIPSLQVLAHDLAGTSWAVVDAILAQREQQSPEIEVWIDQLRTEYAAARAAALITVTQLEELTTSAQQLSAGINMNFLYDAKRRLFGVGYAVGGPVEFLSHYDLLASECRLASLVAIAKGDVPVEHWQTLGRPRMALPKGIAGGPVLLSWSGTMFEYLMPLLLMRSLTNSLLDDACREAVRQQIAYGNARQVPWGISECAYGALDANQIYQYRAFGVPCLALKPGLEDDLVVCPYATMLALLVDPAAALDNLKRLRELHFDGPMGLYESVDFSLENARDGAKGVVIYTYMAHHQGMSLVALDDVLHHGVMAERFHADVRVRAVESLLYEGVPLARATAEAPEMRESKDSPTLSAALQEPVERMWREDTSTPRVHIQGNGHYSLMVTNAGGGYSRWKEFDLSRWRSDTTLDPWGSFLYIRDLRSNAAWSPTLQPFGAFESVAAEETSVCFPADRAEFTRRVSGIETVLEVTVAADDDAELRRLTITNHSLRSRQLDFTSYLELALAPHRTDSAHPAFAKMFVETECPESGVLLATRRGRAPEDAPIWAAHILTGASGEIEYETDRRSFIGRTNTTANPGALRNKLSGSTGAVLDPIFSLRCRATLAARGRLELTFVTLAAASRPELLVLVAKYQRPGAAARALELAWTRAQLQFRYLGLGAASVQRFQELAGHLIYPNSRLRPWQPAKRNRLGQSNLWEYGISGDLPMLVATVSDGRHLPLVRELLIAQTYWRWHGFRADLIILNQEALGYDQPLHQQLLRQIEAHSSETGINRPGGVFLREWYNIPPDRRDLFLSAASVVLSGSRGPLQQQLVGAVENPLPPPFVPSGDGTEVPSPPLPFLHLPYFNGLGGFTQDGREYAIYLTPGNTTPAPWANVMANRDFGTVVTESGLGCTWAGNSQMNRLTPWHNDPVSDPQSEAIYIRDEQSGAVWTPTPLPIRENDAYRARHGQGYSEFEHNSHAIGQELTVFVPVTEDGSGDPVKICRLRLRNDSGRPRRLTIAYFAEWVLGSIREDQQGHVQTAFDQDCGALLATQFWSGSRAGALAFVASSPRATSYSGDRTHFLGRNRSSAKPAAMKRVRLDNRTESTLEPAAALQLSLIIEAGHEMEVIFLLGQSRDLYSMRELVQRYSSPAQVENALAATRQYWNHRLGVLQVRTPQLSVDFLLNRWLLYQTLSSRFWARSGLYQSSGAFGFRDQLQDSMALLYAAPELARQHILKSAAHQFLEGDVQHWWHAETGMGVRTRCSDDLVWLPFVVAQYVTVTGDTGVLHESVPFIEGPPLLAHEHERMFTPEISTQCAPLWEHCRRALDKAWNLGVHQLPLFGSGDWNDGMNLVGAEGRGESVWLGWFLCAALKSFADLLDSKQPVIAHVWRERATTMAQAVEAFCWDGEWYLRGFFDDGSPLGSRANQEAQIDSLPQSWAVISNSGNPDRAEKAMQSAERRLVSARDRVVRLFDPPFDHSLPHPGYIMGYPPGLRENGGQYTHGALWMALAYARMGDGNAAVRLLTMMNPVESSRDPDAVSRYRGEPYVVAADVSAPPATAGQAGWTWYTGSAAWMYRVWVEEVLGFQLRGDQLTITPAIPDDWPGFEITYRYHSTVYEIEVLRAQSQAIPVNITIHLIDDREEHHIKVWIPVVKTEADRFVLAERSDG